VVAITPTCLFVMSTLVLTSRFNPVAMTLSSLPTGTLTGPVVGIDKSLSCLPTGGPAIAKSFGRLRSNNWRGASTGASGVVGVAASAGADTCDGPPPMVCAPAGVCVSPSGTATSVGAVGCGAVAGVSTAALAGGAGGAAGFGVTTITASATVRRGSSMGAATDGAFVCSGCSGLRARVARFPPLASFASDRSPLAFLLRPSNFDAKSSDPLARSPPSHEGAERAAPTLLMPMTHLGCYIAQKRASNIPNTA
jgi:hypothetical protein